MGRPGKRVVFLSVCKLRGHAEVGQLDDTIFRCQDIAALNVSMNDSLSVQILKTFEHLFDVNGDECLGEAPKLLVEIL